MSTALTTHSCRGSVAQAAVVPSHDLLNVCGQTHKGRCTVTSILPAELTLHLLMQFDLVLQQVNGSKSHAACWAKSGNDVRCGAQTEFKVRGKSRGDVYVQQVLASFAFL